MKLPPKFVENMKKLLPEAETEAFFASYDQERYYGIRANTLKLDSDALPELIEKAGAAVAGDRVPWCGDGYYYTEGQPGRSALYHAGAYYIQEPSAMYPGANVPLKDGANVLDICAAPGGKTTQLAARMKGKGLLVSNDINEERTKALVKNIQMAGITNAIVTNETPEKLAERFEGFFDVIVVDAPCSGEGMFRKDEEAVVQWESFKSERCREMQDSILEEVHKMLKPGGVISYSTCTFALLENESTIAAFMERHPDYKLLETPKVGGVADGIPFNGNPELKKCARLWPHKVKGEGHFTAFLQKETDGVCDDANEEISEKKGKKQKKEKFSSFKKLENPPVEMREYFDSYMSCGVPSGNYFTMGQNIYYLPVKLPNPDGLKLPMAGVGCGQVLRMDYKPCHRLALTLSPENYNYSAELDIGSDALERYLRGETVVADGSTHFIIFGKEYDFEKVAAERLNEPCCVAVRAGSRRFILGLGIISGATIKNLYPKGWRRFQ